MIERVIKLIIKKTITPVLSEHTHVIPRQCVEWRRALTLPAGYAYQQ